MDRIQKLQSARRYWGRIALGGVVLGDWRHGAWARNIARKAYMNALCELEALGAL